ncbi:SDR family oxidoreductase [Rhodococcus sp. ABRD24]|uniref:SDR family NAD(P)-dependent oxidoreductase n=1 Tax=Rhodococcus sp. ABRD24 TaxID=2507582 RepID=UPI00103D1BFA|nr:SDR family NAD(P)-dependent oxidoreductase [Rhodococcus sp. ABRD24]QBJ96568.1 SDR family oxidoreductase [Rhodococcus sp. ABRD24]
MTDNRNKAVFVTGAASGLGEATAERLATEGYDLALVDLNGDGVEVVADRLRRTGANVWSRALDVSNEADVIAALEGAVAAHSGLWAAVNVAGIGVPSVFSELTREMWDRTFAVNMTGTFLIAKAAAAHFGDRGGRIVNVASIAAQQGGPFLVDYSASKGAVVSFTRALARALAPKGVNVNCVAPGLIRTQMWRDGGDWMAENVAGAAGLTSEEVFEASIVRQIPLGRPQTAQDVAGAIAYLVSDDGVNVTGQVMNVDGGAVMH